MRTVDGELVKVTADAVFSAFHLLFKKAFRTY
jgi:hypothetical protein